MQITITKEVMKSQIEVLRAYLQTVGIDLKQMNAYNCLSKMYGFPDWNTLSAALKNEEN